MFYQTKVALMATLFLTLGLSTFFVFATEDPCSGHYLGKKPPDSYIQSTPVKSNSDIQAAECSHNTRMSKQQFAWFKIDPSKNKNHGAPYGECFATASAPPTQLEPDSNYDVFYWNGLGGQSGTGTGPIRDPETGELGWENNSGTFHRGQGPGTNA